MKNICKILVLVAVLFSASANAQTTKWGIRGGVSIPNLKSVDDNIYSKGYTSVTGYDFSIFGDFGITKKFSIKTDLGVIKKGGERNGMQPIPASLLGDLAQMLPPGQPVFANFNNSAVFTYIEIPVLAKYQWSVGKNLGFYVNGGPYIDFMLNPTQVTSGTSSLYYDEAGSVPVLIPANPQAPPQTWIMVPLPPQNFTAETDISKDLATMDFGAMLGVGLAASIGKQSELFLDIRGAYGFIPLQKDTETYGTVHMGNVSFAVGYAYVINKKSK